MKQHPEAAVQQSTSRRSGRAHRAVLAATLALFEELGYQRLTVDGIAARAGASKATIYRWWPNKSAILMEAFLTTVEPEITFPDTGSVREDLIKQVSALVHILGGTQLGKLVVSLLGEAQHDDSLAEALRDGWLEPRRIFGREVLQRAIARGELQKELDLDLALDSLYGPVYLRLLFGHAPLDVCSLEALVERALHGIAGPMFHELKNDGALNRKDRNGGISSSRSQEARRPSR